MSKTYKIISVNAGSSSIKFKLYEVDERTLKAKTLSESSKYLKVLTSGLVERIGHEDGIFTMKNSAGEKVKVVLPIMDHDTGVKLVLEGLIKNGIIKSLEEINGIGNRVVQGGPYFSDSALFDEYTYEKIKELIPLDPLHAQAHLTCFDAFHKALPNVGQVAVFDTAFHQTMEPKEYMYAIPYEYYENYKCRRYGAHGTSHKYISIVGKETYLRDKEHSKIITCHIGSGASVSAIKDGKVIATSMGLTPLAGVVMGTRCGDIDPSCMPYLCDCTGKSYNEMYDIFNHKSGLLGLSGISDDTRDIEDGYYKGDEKAILATQMYCQKIADYIAMYYGKLGGCDLIVCSAGVFENSHLFRELTFRCLQESFGITIDAKLNEKMIRGNAGLISAEDSKIPVAVIPTDEELMIVLDTARLLKL